MNKRPAQRRSRLTKCRGLAWTVLLAGAMTGCSYLNPNTAGPANANGDAGSAGQTTISYQGKTVSSAPPPAPIAIATAKVPKAQTAPKSAAAAPPAAAHRPSGDSPLGGWSYAGSLIMDEPGSQLMSWNKTSVYCPETTGFVGDGKVGTDSSGDVTLTTSGKAGSCAGIISPGTVSSGVIEAEIDFPAMPGNSSVIANWTGFWLTNGAHWPGDGELDAVEVQPVNGSNAVTWHSGSSTDLFSASTSGFAPIQLPADGPDLSPGWHTVDIVYTRGFFAVYYDGALYTSYTSYNVTGDPLNVYLTTANTPDTSSLQEKLGGAPMNSDSSSPVLALKYLKIWSCR
jgi:hypothetical protein